MKRLIAIQQNLRSRKDKSDDKGRYKYRSAEDILESVKPILAEQKCAVILTDSVWESEKGEFFLRATAILLGDGEFTTKDDKGEVVKYHDTKEIARAEGYAKMDDHITKKYNEKSNTWYEVRGMSNEQCTGSASSYARKYALCGLFAIDNSENDPDSKGIQDDEPEPATKDENTKAMIDKILACKNADGINAIKDEVKKADDGYITKTFLARTKALGLEFDKKQGKYVVQSK